MHNTILIVDDSATNIDILFEALSDDYEIRVANSGESALESIRKKQPDMVLLDVMMPGIDGYEVCRRLKSNHNTFTIPIIFITALSETQDEAKGLALGAVDFITKPFNKELVKARIKNHIELKLLRDHLESLVEERTRELELTQDTVIECIVRIGEFRNTEIGEHIVRVRAYVQALADSLMKMDAYKELFTVSYVKLLYKCVPLHDIGKVVIPDEILLKPGKLTPEEFEVIKTHTIAGKDILLSAEKKLGKNSFLSLAMQMAISHHERWDGKGYPYGYSGENIPIPARIMAIADVYDALVSKRVYKPAFTHNEAIKIILDGRGTQFDPTLVDVLIKNQERFLDISEMNVDSL